MIELFKRRQPRTALGLRLSRAIAEEEEREQAEDFHIYSTEAAPLRLTPIFVGNPEIRGLVLSSRVAGMRRTPEDPP